MTLLPKSGALAAVAAAVIATAALALAAPQAVAAGGSCGPGTFPKIEHSYGTDEFEITFTFNLKKCWATTRPFEVKGSLHRDSLTEKETLQRDQTCRAGRPSCRLTLRLVHPAIEHSDYIGDVFFDVPDGDGSIAFSETCTSLGVTSTCDL